jgi:hypothetical protein
VQEVQIKILKSDFGTYLKKEGVKTEANKSSITITKETRGKKKTKKQKLLSKRVLIPFFSTYLTIAYCGAATPESTTVHL